MYVSVAIYLMGPQTLSALLLKEREIYKREK